MAARTFKSLDLAFSVGHQDVTRTEITKFGDHKVRFTIKSDSYNQQCYAVIDVLNSTDGVKWERIGNIAYSNMKTPEKLYYFSEMQDIRRNLSSARVQGAVGGQFTSDVLELQRIAKLILA